MITTSSRRIRSWRWKMSIAMLALSAAFVGGGQALAPSPAIAMVDLGSGGQECQFWIDCFNQAESGSGGGDSSGGAGPSGGGSSGGEVIHVHDPKCSDPNVTCVPVGGDNRAPSQTDPDTGTSQDEPFTRGRGALPPCRKGQTPRRDNCSAHNFKCVVKGQKGQPDEVRWVNTPADCRLLNAPPPEPTPAKKKEFRKKWALCYGIQEAKDRIDDQIAKGLIDVEDYEALRDQYHKNWKDKGCDDLPENPV
jgi:hypothetical protein